MARWTFAPALVFAFAAAALSEGVERAGTLGPRPDNPRNSEGDFIALADGRVLFVYSHFTGGAGDDDAAHLASRVSSDGGKSWSAEDAAVVEGDAANVMSVSLLRLNDGRIGLFYLEKYATADCRPVMRISSDEAKTWGAARQAIDEPGYYVMNNDRAVQLSTGRMVLPLALHNRPGWVKPDWQGEIMCYLSDDGGASWRRSRDTRRGRAADGRRVTLQEPGVVELKDGRLMMLCRTDAGSQWISHSADGGETWTEPGPSEIISPVSPATIERVPTTGDLLLVWNNHAGIDAALRGKRTPLTAAISRDEGRSWEHVQNLADDPNRWYCYTAMEFVGDHVFLAYCGGDRRENNGLAETHITRVPVGWFYR